jgi:GNAT superfamily N-acetyltransferase
VTRPTPEIRVASLSSAAGIAAAIRSGFDADRLSITIYGSRGIVAYIADQIEAGGRHGDTRYWVAIIGNRVAGCLEMRYAPRLAWVNYLAVLPEWRSQRLGSRLLAAAIDAEYWDHPQCEVGLDVFADNAGAVRWYEGLGFASAAERVIAQVDIATPPLGRFFLSGWPQSALLHRRYGFSELSVVTDEATHRVGLLGDEWFRLPNPASALDPGLRGALRAIDSGRRGLLTATEDLPQSIRGVSRVIAQIRRMRVAAADLRRRLSRT